MLKPYINLARLNRPIGIWLLMWPAWWAIITASPQVTPYVTLTLFTLGAVIMRSAGCVFNDMVDHKFDKQVARTKTRPIASSQINHKAALFFLSLLLCIGLIILLQFNRLTIYLGVFSLLLVASYPFMKRWTYWPQAFLGLTFNWGALMGWTAITNSLSIIPFLLYGAGFFWTLGYDTIYAHQDKEDDLLIGVKSTALKLGDKTQIWLYGFYGLTIGLLIIAGKMLKASPWFYGVLGLVALHFFWQVKTLRINNTANCWVRFKSNQWVGGLIFIALLFA